MREVSIGELSSEVHLEDSAVEAPVQDEPKERERIEAMMARARRIRARTRAEGFDD